jgi:hypothetical protein
MAASDLVELKKLRYEKAHSLAGLDGRYHRSRKLDAIGLDVFQISQLEGVLHETVHFVLRRELYPFDDEMEEDQVDAFVERLVEWINKSDRRFNYWRTLIEQHIKKMSE